MGGSEISYNSQIHATKVLHYETTMKTPKNKPWNFCETPEEKCTMNYCDENGCQNRKRNLVEPKKSEVII